jgi:hypothetical protein
MLAEIFILRLETAAIGARIQKEAALSNNTAVHSKQQLHV